MSSKRLYDAGKINKQIFKLTENDRLLDLVTNIILNNQS